MRCRCDVSKPRTGPPLPETLRMLKPLAPTLEVLNLSGNKLGGTITSDVEVFTKLTELRLLSCGLDGASPRAVCSVTRRAVSDTKF